MSNPRVIELEFRVPTSPRLRHGKEMSWIDANYRKAQYEFRRALIEGYGHFETIPPRQLIKEAYKNSKSRPYRPEVLPFRNVLLEYKVFLAGRTPVDKDNVEKFILDSLGPITAKQPTKSDLALNWQPLYKNDKQVIGGEQYVVDYWPYNHFWMRITELTHWNHVYALVGTPDVDRIPAIAGDPDFEAQFKVKESSNVPEF